MRAAAGVGEGVRREGLVPAGLIAGDGTKLKANASMAASAAQLDAQITELEAVIDAVSAASRPAPPDGTRSNHARTAGITLPANIKTAR